MNTTQLQPYTPALEQGYSLGVAPLLLSVSLKEPALSLIRTQLEIDINMKSRGWNPNGFTLFELLEIEQLVTRHATKKPIEPGNNVLLTHSQRLFLACYVNRYCELATESEDIIRQQAYDRMVYELTDGAMLINRNLTPVTLFSYAHRVASFTRPLSVLWALTRSIGSRLLRGRQYTSPAPALA